MVARCLRKNRSGICIQNRRKWIFRYCIRKRISLLRFNLFQREFRGLQHFTLCSQFALIFLLNLFDDCLFLKRWDWKNLTFFCLTLTAFTSLVVSLKNLQLRRKLLLLISGKESLEASKKLEVFRALPNFLFFLLGNLACQNYIILLTEFFHERLNLNIDLRAIGQKLSLDIFEMLGENLFSVLSDLVDYCISCLFADFAFKCGNCNHSVINICVQYKELNLQHDLESFD